MAAGLASSEDAASEQFRPPAAVVAGSVVALTIYIPGLTRPSGRPRARVVQAAGKKPFVQMYPDNQSRDWADEAVDILQRQIARIEVTEIPGQGNDFTLPFTGRVMLTMRFNIKKPISYPANVVNMVRKPDLDNLAKAVLDAMVKARIIEDDNLVTDLSLSKRYVEPGHPEGCEIDLTAFG
jgi:Holliday junction resolvase RusA-like endonuclease